MPPKHSIRYQQKKGYYHLFNRGVEKEKSFRMRVFLTYLKAYLQPEMWFSYSKSGLILRLIGKKGKIFQVLGLKNFAEEIQSENL
jgi:hypothetical protein